MQQRLAAGAVAATMLTVLAVSAAWLQPDAPNLQPATLMPTCAYYSRTGDFEICLPPKVVGWPLPDNTIDCARSKKLPPRVWTAEDEVEVRIETPIFMLKEC
jgi:hypothetical protein